MKSRIAAAIERDPLMGAVQEIVQKRGEPAYLVGGALRDMALGRSPVDLDFASASPYETAVAVAERFESRVVSMGSEAPFTYRIPVRDRLLDWASLAEGTLESDLERRDFTVNAMAYDLIEERLVDLHGGLKDLNRRIVRMTSPAVFAEDPLRILKAYRMLAQLEGFTLDEATDKALRAESHGLVDVPPERICRELELTLACAAPGRVIRDMAAAGALFIVIPELKSLQGLDQNAYHHADAFEHTMEALEALDGPPGWLEEMGLPRFSPRQWVLLRLACLFHDSGKSATKSVDDGGGVHFYGHQKNSSDIARSVLGRLRFSREISDAVAELCLNHLRPIGLVKSRPGRTAHRRLVHTLGDLLPLLLALAYADKSASKGDGHPENLAALRELAREILAVARSDGEELRRLPKLVDGLEALEILGMERPGPELGRALDALMERQVDGALTTKGEAVVFLKKWAERGRSRA